MAHDDGTLTLHWLIWRRAVFFSPTKGKKMLTTDDDGREVFLRVSQKLMGVFDRTCVSGNRAFDVLYSPVFGSQKVAFGSGMELLMTLRVLF